MSKAIWKIQRKSRSLDHWIWENTCSGTLHEALFYCKHWVKRKRSGDNILDYRVVPCDD